MENSRTPEKERQCEKSAAEKFSKRIKNLSKFPVIILKIEAENRTEAN